jgi:hypothetical protein
VDVSNKNHYLANKRRSALAKILTVFDFIHFWSVTLVNTIKNNLLYSAQCDQVTFIVCTRLYMFRFFSKPSSEGGVNEVVL